MKPFNAFLIFLYLSVETLKTNCCGQHYISQTSMLNMLLSSLSVEPLESQRGRWPAKNQLEPLFFFFSHHGGLGGGVKGQLSQKPQRILLGEDPWDFSLKPGHHGQVSQVCPAAAPGLEYICVFIGWCCTTSHNPPAPPDHFPSQCYPWC